MEKEKLIEAIRSKGFHNSLISIYYNIGRALPFTAQRFPDGRVSNWYASQYVEVHRVVPGGKGGRYGNAYGFYFRNGERADAYDTPELNWCKKEEIEPQGIPCAACGSWFLLDILGKPTAEPAKIYGLDDVLDFGKHKGDLLRNVVHNDYGWVNWAIRESDHFFCDVEKIVAEHEKSRKILLPEDILTFGKYKGQSIRQVFETDPNYLVWVTQKMNDVIINFEKLK
jgi:hypothetical protein